MSTWYINKKGISLNEGGRWITFSFLKLKDGRRLLRTWIKLPFSKYSYETESFITFRKINYR